MGLINNVVNAFRRPSAQERAEDIARTNFIAAAVRNLVGGQVEVYVKWLYGGAFNGAAWMLNDNEGADVFFYRGPPRQFGPSHSVSFARGEAVAHIPAAHASALHATIAAADKAFERIYAVEGVSLLNSVARLQFWLWISATDQVAADRVVSEFAGRLDTFGNVSRLPVHAMPLEGWQCDVNVVVPRTPHDLLIEKLGDILPGIAGPLYGTGATVELSEPSSSEKAWLRGALVTARHA